MSIVNFTIPNTLERKVEKAIKDRGFSSRAEFFRMAAIKFIEVDSPQDRISQLSDAIAYEIGQKYRGKKIPSLSKQLDDIEV